MEGLEVSEVLLSYTKENNDIFRFDSNYFQKEYLRDEGLIKSKPNKSLKDIEVSLLSFGAYSLNNYVDYKSEGVPFIRGVNMKKGRISFSDMIFIDEEANSLLWKSEVKPLTVLLSMSGTIGDVALASKKWDYPINSNQDIAKINTNGKLNPYYLFAFLLGKFGQNYLQREARGSVQQHVFLSQMEMFNIPLLSEHFENVIQNVIEKSDRQLEHSENNYSQAESLLLQTLGLQDFKPSKEAVSIKSFAESFGTTGRLDAEYYQPKYEEIEEKIKQNDYILLREVIEKVDTGEYSEKYYHKNEHEGLVFYIRSLNIKGGQVEIDENYFVPKNNFVRIAREGEIVTSRVGSVGVFGEIRSALNESVYSDNILNFRLPKKYIASVYTLLLNSEPYFQLIDRLARGSVQQRLNQETLKDLIIPIIKEETQQEISALVEKSFSLKAESEHLLEVAKTAVETAIEKDEKTAMEYIENEIALKN